MLLERLLRFGPNVRDAIVDALPTVAALAKGYGVLFLFTLFTITGAMFVLAGYLVDVQLTRTAHFVGSSLAPESRAVYQTDTGARSVAVHFDGGVQAAAQNVVSSLGASLPAVSARLVDEARREESARAALQAQSGGGFKLSEDTARAVQAPVLSGQTVQALVQALSTPGAAGNIAIPAIPTRGLAPVATIAAPLSSLLATTPTPIPLVPTPTPGIGPLPPTATRTATPTATATPTPDSGTSSGAAGPPGPTAAPAQPTSAPAQPTTAAQPTVAAVTPTTAPLPTLPPAATATVPVETPTIPVPTPTVEATPTVPPLPTPTVPPPPTPVPPLPTPVPPPVPTSALPTETPAPTPAGPAPTGTVVLILDLSAPPGGQTSASFPVLFGGSAATATPTPIPTATPDGFVASPTPTPAPGTPTATPSPTATPPLTPGTPVARTLNLQNNGSNPFTYSIGTSGGTGPLYEDTTSGLQLVIKRNGTEVYRGPLQTSGQLIGLLSRGEQDVLEIEVSLPLDAGNTMADQSVNVSIDFTSISQ